MSLHRYNSGGLSRKIYDADLEEAMMRDPNTAEENTFIDANTHDWQAAVLMKAQLADVKDGASPDARFRALCALPHAPESMRKYAQ
jgi:hypothetical protein